MRALVSEAYVSGGYRHLHPIVSSGVQLLVFACDASFWCRWPHIHACIDKRARMLANATAHTCLCFMCTYMFIHFNECFNYDVCFYIFNCCILLNVLVRNNIIKMFNQSMWLHGLYGLYGPRCLLSYERPLNLITHSFLYVGPLFGNLVYMIAGL